MLSPAGHGGSYKTDYMAWLEPEKHNESFAKNIGREKGAAVPSCHQEKHLEYENKTNLQKTRQL